ncbi:MAG: hypothetical protein IJW69_00535, partial [Clostridia bacterium]|nr:hypothetical protein [Clostridia bacterium]
FVCFALTKNRQGGFSSQNDVKFLQTHARKVFAKPFSKGLRGVGRRPTSFSFMWQVKQQKVQ